MSRPEAACALPGTSGPSSAPSTGAAGEREQRTWVGPTAPERQQLLRRTRTVALVGVSDKPSRASHFVATYLLSSSDYDVWFVNPRVSRVLGREVYPSLADLPVVPDLVDVFRRHEDLPEVLGEAREVGASALWLQLGSWHEDVAREGEAAGLTVVMDRCLKIEHARFHGGLALAGFDTGVVTSRRRPRA